MDFGVLTILVLIVLFFIIRYLAKRLSVSLASVSNKLLGFRWSLYVVRGDKQLIYAMHDDSVLGIVGYVMGYFQGGAKPVPPWSLYLNFNKKHQSFELRPEHFTTDGQDVTPLFIQEIESIDPGYLDVTGGDPVFLEAATNRELPIVGKIDYSSSVSVLASLRNSREGTFFSIMDDVFGHRSEP